MYRQIVFLLNLNLCLPGISLAKLTKALTKLPDTRGSGLRSEQKSCHFIFERTDRFNDFQAKNETNITEVVE